MSHEKIYKPQERTGWVMTAWYNPNRDLWGNPTPVGGHILPCHSFQRSPPQHSPLPPSSPLQRDVVRAAPATYDPSGRVLRAARFDTALFLEKLNRQHRHLDEPEKDGMERQVKAIFTLPQYLQKHYSGSLAYVELFSPFSSSFSKYHSLYMTSPALRSDNTRRTLVIPTSEIVLACHLTPHFSHLHPKFALNRYVDLLAVAEVVFLNHYYNHHTFLLVNYWRRMQHRLPHG
ncbi:hypothetical protein BDV93DRAFT_566496 [Ceratobasidium sp. AG-I]|nr:hypothetical protein BDV93DRAFT_566496 [Ceratobasidium sp. AG-I]